MDITLRIPDELADDYRKHGPSVEAAALATLLRFRRIGPTDRAFVVAHEDRARLESLLGYGHITTSTDLRDKVERLARLQVGEIEIPFSAAEWQEITHRATKRGITAAEECRRIVAAMHDQFFNFA
jgi:hypothetical protein